MSESWDDEEAFSNTDSEISATWQRSARRRTILVVYCGFYVRALHLDLHGRDTYYLTTLVALSEADTLGDFV